jgi:hypothetical protein
MSGIKSYLKKKTEERLAKFYAHVRPEIKDRVESGKPVSKDELLHFRCNSYEQKLLHSILDDEALVDRIVLYMNQNGSRALYDTELAENYQDALLREFFPMLLSRFQTLKAENRILKSELDYYKVQPGEVEDKWQD